MLELLKAPYPLYLFSTRRVYLILCVGAFVSLFLLVFQPFGTDQANFAYKNYFLAGYGLVISSSILLLEAILARIFFRPKLEDAWTVGKQILWVTIYMSFAMICCYFYKQWFFQLPVAWADLLYFYGLALSIGVFPVAIMTLLDYIYKLQKNQAVGDSISSNQLAASPHNKPRNDNARILTLTSDNGKDQFELPASQLLYLQAADNYVEIHYKTEEQTAKYILRNSLQKLADQLPSNSIRRCHRSYLVNLQYVERISGNAQGYKLHLLADSIAIPVSRSKSKDILLYFEEQS